MKSGGLIIKAVRVSCAIDMDPDDDRPSAGDVSGAAPQRASLSFQQSPKTDAASFACVMGSSAKPTLSEALPPMQPQKGLYIARHEPLR